MLLINSTYSMSQVLVNRFCLSDELNMPMGSGVYLAASIFDHSCLPNAYPSFVGKKLYIRTLIDLPELDLDKVSQSKFSLLILNRLVQQTLSFVLFQCYFRSLRLKQYQKIKEFPIKFLVFSCEYLSKLSWLEASLSRIEKPCLF